jgi:hypothetical protein
VVFHFSNKCLVAYVEVLETTKSNSPLVLAKWRI